MEGEVVVVISSLIIHNNFNGDKERMYCPVNI